MADYAEARRLIDAKLAAWRPAFTDDSWVILDDHTIEREWGWVFFYDSRLHQETGDFRYAIAGNSPFIVRRRDGVVLKTGTSQPVENFIREFQADGRLP